MAFVHQVRFWLVRSLSKPRINDAANPEPPADIFPEFAPAPPARLRAVPRRQFQGALIFAAEAMM